MKRSLVRNIEFLYEMGWLRFIPRSWNRFLNPGFQNLAEHHLRVVWISLILAKMEGIRNTDKVIKMALLHDIAESRTGDVDFLQRQYVARNENLGMKDILANTVLEEEFLDLWNEYEKRESIESKIVKDADGLDVDLELKEQEVNGSQLNKNWKNVRVAIKNKFYTKSAVKLWNEIGRSNPHDWHINEISRYLKLKKVKKK